eukprot:TRINITY_DN4990_c0_g1_i2.p1 TRINITY_DN4990_c0_g1~~TRINITY_DN4990_c0_g1_i2.p1  ORF type:complete len:426 (+),score=144.03 TRINITY_DN4990_c0_g1_i2:165-1442(+)
MNLSSVTDYLNAYKGYNKLKRAGLLAARTSDQALLKEIYKISVNTCKESKLLSQYNKLYENPQVKALLDKEPGYAYDQAWIAAEQKALQQLLDKKENELRNYQNLQVKISVRTSYIEIGQIHAEHGNIEEAIQNFLKAKEWMANQHHIDLFPHLKTAYLLTDKFVEIRKYFIHDHDDKDLNDKNRYLFHHAVLVNGISNIIDDDYTVAVHNFLNEKINYTTLERVEEFTSFRDLAAYVTIVGLASLNRNEISHRILREDRKELVIKNPLAHKVLETYMALDFEGTLKSLGELMASLEYDPYIANKRAILMKRIKERLLAQYIKAFKRISIVKVAELFEMHPNVCRETIKELIEARELHSLIDPFTNEIVENPHDRKSRDEVYKRAIDTVEKYVIEKYIVMSRTQFFSVGFNANVQREQVSTPRLI